MRSSRKTPGAHDTSRAEPPKGAVEVRTEASRLRGFRARHRAQPRPVRHAGAAVTIDVHVTSGLPSLAIVGLAEAALKVWSIYTLRLFALIQRLETGDYAHLLATRAA